MEDTRLNIVKNTRKARIPTQKMLVLMRYFGLLVKAETFLGQRNVSSIDANKKSKSLNVIPHGS